MPVFPYSRSWFIIALSLVMAYALPEAGEGPRPLTITSKAMAATFGEALEGRDLQRRQNTICGWVSGNMDLPLTCAPGYQCGINTHNWAANCCQNPANCEYKTACVPYISMGLCNSACLANIFITRCSNSDYPSCYTKKYIYAQYASPFYELDCLATEGLEIVLETYSTAAANPSITSQHPMTQPQPSSPSPLPSTPQPIPTPAPPPTSQASLAPPPTISSLALTSTMTISAESFRQDPSTQQAALSTSVDPFPPSSTPSQSSISSSPPQATAQNNCVNGVGNCVNGPNGGNVVYVGHSAANIRVQLKGGLIVGVVALAVSGAL